ncbi:MAG TPA: hypothetical protein VK975_05165 [Acidimicrobiales bacterium]|nr:hypothetical protein [Acidimicrobiales bacterium]
MTRPAAVDLGGTWRAAPSDPELRLAFPTTDFDDDSWEEVVVPGHWRSHPAFADSNGPLLYRRRVELARPEEGDRVWLVVDGVFYQGDVWLDGCYLGDTEGYFVPHTFEVTECARSSSEHLVGFEVACSPESDLTAKRNLTGVFQHWDCLDPNWNPGGLWRSLRLEHTGPVRVRNLRVLCSSADAREATVKLRAELDSDMIRAVRLRTTLGGVDDVVERTVAAGSNFLDWTLAVPSPELWWPHALGAQPLHALRVEVDVDGRTSHAVERRVGLRSLSWEGWTLSVNGERLFLKGANQGPTRMALGEATPQELRRDVVLAREAGLDLMRLHAHISRPEIYDAADEQGVLVWQDLPLQWGYAQTVRGKAVIQARAAVDLLGHHPSIALWCAHNEPLAIDTDLGQASTRAGSARQLLRLAVKQELPNWNRSVLDRAVARALREVDPTRRVVPHSGDLPRPGSGGSDTHLYFGWYYGDERSLPGVMRALPRLARFVSEFGAQAVPDDAGFCEPDRWPHLDWERLSRSHNLQKARFDRYVPPADHASFDSWRDATQAYQAAVVKHHVETLRRLKYRPTGGFGVFAFGDGHPGVTWAVLDHDRTPKAAFHALVDACRAVIVVADRPPATVAPGTSIALDVHVVSDLRVPIDGAVVEARLSWTGGEHRWRFAGDVPADDCVRVGTVSWEAPDASGPVVLDLTLTAGDVEATNRYESTIGG